MYKALIFDFDGTVADTMYQNYIAWDFALKNHGFSLDKERYFLTEGATPKSIVTSFTNDESTQNNIIKEKEKYFLEHYEIKFFNDVIDFIQEQKQTKQIALVTGGKAIRINHILQKANIKELFDLIITADDVQKGKPHKEPYEKALKNLNIQRNEAIVIENAPFGITSAKSAGIFTIAVETTLEKKYLKKANLIVSNFSEIKKLNIFK